MKRYLVNDSVDALSEQLPHQFLMLLPEFFCFLHFALELSELVRWNVHAARTRGHLLLEDHVLFGLAVLELLQKLALDRAAALGLLGLHLLLLLPNLIVLLLQVIRLLLQGRNQVPLVDRNLLLLRVILAATCQRLLLAATLLLGIVWGQFRPGFGGLLFARGGGSAFLLLLAG